MATANLGNLIINMNDLNSKKEVQPNNSFVAIRKKKKPPSKIIRDLRRLLLFKCRVKNTMKVSQGCQTEPLKASNTNKTTWMTWKKKTWNTTTNNEKKPPLLKEDEVKLDKQEINVPAASSEQPKDNPHSQEITSENLKLTAMYENIENSMKLARLEEPAILTIALRHIVRRTHQYGDAVVFPQINAVDRITLRAHNLPTDPKQLHDLVKQVYMRRKEPLNLEEVYKEFVKAHGRIIFDPNQNWPQCYVYTHNP